MKDPMKDPMKIDFDDPKWTAYVLGELPPEERRVVELELESSEELKLFVEELQIAAFAMKDAMAHEAPVGLTFQQRAVVRAAAEGKATTLVRSERAWFRQPFVWAATGLAAAGLIATVAPALWRSRAVEPTQVAQGPNKAVVTTPETTPNNGLRYGPAENRESTGTPAGKVVAPAPVAAQVDASKASQPEKAEAGSAAPSSADSADMKASAGAGKTFADLPSSALQLDKEVLPTPQPSSTSVASAKPAVSATLPAGAAGGRGGAGGGARGGAASGVAPEFARSAIAPPVAKALSDPLAPPSDQPVRRDARDFSFGIDNPRTVTAQNAPTAPVTVARSLGAVSPFPPLPLGPAAPPTVTPNPVDANAGRADRENLEYELIGDNPYVYVATQQVATVSVDTDTASYSNVRRFLTSGQLPPRGAVRIEEMINYFTYDYPKGASDHPITANIEAAAAPWNPDHRLVRIGVRAKDVQVGDKPSNLVFLIDVSGSMEPAERLPLLKSGLRMLVEKLTENDRVTIVTYAGSSGIALPPTNGTRKEVIQKAIDELRAEGSTNGGEGIQTAYDLAAANFIRGGVNRVVLMTDGDFNVGITDQSALVRLIEEKAQTGVFLSILGVGTGNVKDAMMERLADRGNGQYAYIDSLNEARKVLVEQMGGTLITVAKDVKLQVEFNPAQVSAYRLIGYEDRVLASSDFTNDRRDAGDMGAGHTVTALFEVVPVGVEVNNFPGAGPLRYQQAPPAVARQVDAAVVKEMLNLRIRYKEPEGSQSKLIDFPLVDRGQTFERASVDFRFAAAVAEFGMMLRSSPYRGSATWSSSLAIARESRGADREGYREEFIRLVQLCEQIARTAAR